MIFCKDKGQLGLFIMQGLPGWPLENPPLMAIREVSNTCGIWHRTNTVLPEKEMGNRLSGDCGNCGSLIPFPVEAGPVCRLQDVLWLDDLWLFLQILDDTWGRRTMSVRPARDEMYDSMNEDRGRKHIPCVLPVCGLFFSQLSSFYHGKDNKYLFPLPPVDT